MKCEICGNPVEEMYLKKIRGTFVKDDKGKKHVVCASCQEKLDNDKQEILKHL